MFLFILYYKNIDISRLMTKSIFLQNCRIQLLRNDFMGRSAIIVYKVRNYTKQKDDNKK